MVGKKILIVDENAASRNYLLSFLRERQFNVFEAASGGEALIVAWRDEPDLVLFDPVFSDIKDEEFIQKLRSNSRTSTTPLIALSSDLSLLRKESCLKAGVTEYLIKSSQAIPALEESLARLFNQSDQQKPSKSLNQEEKNSGLLIVFLSAKGGTGTSSLCANLAMNITHHQPEARVVLADLVLPIGSISQIVGYEGKTNLITVADIPSGQTNEEYFHSNLPQPELWKFQLLAGSPDPQHGNKLKGERIEQIVDRLRSAYDFVILDIGRSLSRIGLPLIQKADLITLIVSTDQSTIQLTRTVWNYLQTQGIEDQRIYAILNRAVGLEGLTKNEAEKIIGLKIKTTMPYMGSNFSLANNLNQPITTKYPTDTASIIFKETAGDMVRLARHLRARENV
ncbi:MAG TPA: response regulator [Anaerolineales bacterium]|nr:response regulator [Anaerolineales bacterium]